MFVLMVVLEPLRFMIPKLVLRSIDIRMKVDEVVTAKLEMVVSDVDLDGVVEVSELGEE